MTAAVCASAVQKLYTVIFGKKGVWIILLIFIFAMIFIAGMRFSHHSLKQSLIEETHRNRILQEKLQTEISRNNAVKCEIEEIDAYLQGKHSWMDSTRAMTAWLYRRFKPELALDPIIAFQERTQSWTEAISDINAELFFCDNWFDTVNVLSVWVFQNTRVGNPEYHIEQTFGNNFKLWSDTVNTLSAEWFYEINNSDSVTNNCGSHCFYATRLFEYFGIKSFHLSLRNHDRSEDGHMLNVLHHPGNDRWYPVDHMFGIRWLRKGEWLDMASYMKLANTDLQSIDVERFGTFKFHIYDSPFIYFDNWSMKTASIASFEASNHPHFFRIVASFTLKKHFPAYQKLFDGIAESYGHPHHSDWIDLSRRFPLYGARLFSPLDFKEQPYADSLLNVWKL